VLLDAAHAVQQAESLTGQGLTGDCRIDWPALIARRRTFTEPATAAQEEWLGGAGVELLHGEARIVGDGELLVDGDAIRAEHVVIASGARPRELGIRGEELLIHADAVMELDSLPGRVVFVGGGYVSFEFAGLVQRAGASTTILERSDRSLKGFDADLAEMLVERYSSLGIDVVMDAPVTELQEADTGILVKTSNHEFETDLVVHGAGRVPDIDSLGLESAGVDYDSRGVTVDERLRSVSNSRFHAAGDAASSGLPLTPVASVQGRVVAADILGEDASFDGRATPSVVFSDPPLATVGMGAAEARSLEEDISITFNDMSSWFTQKRLGHTHAAAKVLTESASGRVVGAHLLGPVADEVINVFALAVRHGLTKTQLDETLWAYPTAGYDIEYLL
jgi:glutathione reductase (NADPH)